MDPEVWGLLDREASPLQSGVTAKVKRCIRASQNFLAQRYQKWNENEFLYRNFREPDEEDDEIASGPLTQGVKKIVVPMSYAIIQSILAWQMSYFTDRKPIIPVEGLGANDFHPAIVHEHLFEHQYDRMRPRGTLALLQWFLDGFRYGLGVVANAWTVREFLGFMRQAQPFAFSGEVIGYDQDMLEETQVAYEGNQIHNILPFDFYPDPRVPLGRFQDGEFCGYRTRSGRAALQVKEKGGLYAGIRHIPHGRDEMFRGARGGNVWGETELGTPLGIEGEGGLQLDETGKPFVTLHHLHVTLRPDELDEWEVGHLAGGDLPRVWLVTLANLQRTVRMEKANLPYPGFPYSLIEPNFDLHSPANPGILEILSQPAYHLNWLVNAREANVRRSLNFELVYDPSLIERDDLENPSPSGLVRLKPDAYHELDAPTLDRVVKQMPVADVTQGHMNDVGYWINVMEQISGANKMIQGLSNTGRRAATEVQYQQQLAAGRMKLLALIMALQGVMELAEQQLANTKTFLAERLSVPTLPQYREIVGADYVNVLPDLLQGSFRIPLLEQGIPTDKTFHANAIKEVLAMVMQNPQAAMEVTSQLNAMELLLEYLRLLGKKNLRDFVKLPPGAQMGPGGQPMIPGQMVGNPNAQIQVQPDEQVMRQQERGNLIPYEGRAPSGGNMGTPGIGDEGNLFA